MQLIICFESRSNVETDYIYIHEFIKHFYNQYFRKFKIDKVPLETKGNYNRVENKVKKLLNEYHHSNKNEKQFVVFCLDTDYGKEGSAVLNKKIIEYCKSQQFYLVWFHRDVEEVFLRKRVDSDEKRNVSTSFLKHRLIQKVDSNPFKLVDIHSTHFQTSNLKEILDEIFDETFNRK